MRDPVSTNAVANIVKLPPASMLRAAPKNALGLCNEGSRPPDNVLPLGGITVIRSCQSSN